MMSSTRDTRRLIDDGDDIVAVGVRVGGAPPRVEPAGAETDGQPELALGAGVACSPKRTKSSRRCGDPDAGSAAAMVLVDLRAGLHGKVVPDDTVVAMSASGAFMLRELRTAVEYYGTKRRLLTRLETSCLKDRLRSIIHRADAMELLPAPDSHTETQTHPQLHPDRATSPSNPTSGDDLSRLSPSCASSAARVRPFGNTSDEVGWSSLPDEVLMVLHSHLRHVRDQCKFSSLCRKTRSLARDALLAHCRAQLLRFLSSQLAADHGNQGAIELECDDLHGSRATYLLSCGSRFMQDRYLVHVSLGDSFPLAGIPAIQFVSLAYVKDSGALESFDFRMRPGQDLHLDEAPTLKSVAGDIAKWMGGLYEPVVWRNVPCLPR